MESDALLYIRAIGYGASVVFYGHFATRLFFEGRRQSSQHGRFVYAVSSLCFALIGLLDLVWFFIDTTAIDNCAWYDQHPLISGSLFIAELLVMMLICHGVLSICRLRPPHMGHMVSSFIPLFLLLGAFIATGWHPLINIAVGVAMLYTVSMVIYVFMSIRRYSKLLEDTYTNTGTRGVKWVYNLVGALLAVFALWIATGFSFTDASDDIVYLFASFVPWGYYVYRINQQNFDIHVMEDIARAQEPDETEPDPVVQPAEPAPADAQPAAPAPVAPAPLKMWQRPEFDTAVRQFCAQRKNYTNPDLSIEDVARAVGSNRTYVSRWCNAQGINFSTYIAELRLEYASQLLLTTDLTITEVLEQAGFNNPRHFRTVFQAHYGCLPSEYRQVNKALNANPDIPQP